MAALFRQPRLCWEWKWMAIGLITLQTILTCVSATVVCSDCRSIDLQKAPAVGLSLAPGYGATSVQFVNGTISDIVLVPGRHEYLQAMIRWQRLGVEVTNCTVQSPQNDNAGINARGSISQLWLWMRALRQYPWGQRNPAPQPSNDLEESLKPIADMLNTLFRATKEFVSLNYSMVFLSVPDFVTPRSQRISQKIRPLLRQAELQSFRSRYLRQSQSASLELYGLEDCPGIPVDQYREVPDEECEAYNGRSIQSMLFVAVDGTSLSLRSMIREDGMFYPDLGATEVLWKAVQIEDENAYFAWVDRELRQFVEKQDVAFDLLLLSGINATLPEFQEIIRDVLKDNGKISPADYVRSRQDLAFAAARGAARVARVGLCNDFDACLPNSWCPISEHCRKWGGIGRT